MIQWKKLQKGKGKKVEFKLKINLWKVFLTGVLIVLFLPFFATFFSLPGDGNKVNTSQAILDIKDEKVKEVLVQDEKMILT